MAKNEREPVTEFIITQASFFSRNSQRDEDKLLARKYVIALRDPARRQKLIEGIEV